MSHTSSTSLLDLFLQKRNLCSGFELLVSYHPSLIFAQHWRTAKRRKEGLEGNFGLEFLLRCNCILASVWRIKTTVILSFFLLQFLEIYDLVLLWIKLYVLKQKCFNSVFLHFCNAHFNCIPLQLFSCSMLAFFKKNWIGWRLVNQKRKLLGEMQNALQNQMFASFFLIFIF